MGKPARIGIVLNHPADALIIRDAGSPWDVHLTVTNDVERVVDDLRNHGFLNHGRRLYCYDSDNTLDEILLDGDAKFKGFAPVPPTQVKKIEGRC